MAVETSSDQDYACFSCGKWKSRDISESCPTCHFPLTAAKSCVSQTVGSYVLEEYKARGFYGATFRATNRIGKPFAIKLCPKVLYDEYGKDFDSEIRKYRELGSHSNIAELVDAGDGAVCMMDQAVPVYYVVMEWIDGLRLNDFISDASFSVADMYAVIIDVASGVARFESRNLWHNDLKADNILVKQLSDEELGARRTESRFIAKIIDSGSAVFRQSERHKTVDDLRFLAQHINRMRVRLLDKRTALPNEDRFFLDELGKVIARALDEHPSRSYPKAQSLLAEVRALYERRLLLDEVTNVRLSDPFAYLNANDFPGEAYVNILFSDRFPWLNAIMAGDPQPMLITGPRGCGKTMLLRSLSLKTRLHPLTFGEPQNEITSRVGRDNFAAFFVSARIEIGNHCPLTKLPKWAERDDLVNLYFNLLLAYVVVETLNFASAKQLMDIEAAAEAELCEYIAIATGIRAAVTFGGTMSGIQDLQRRIMLDAFPDRANAEASGPAFLSNLSAILRRRISFFRTKHIIFLLDDFSLPKVPREVQQFLLPTIWNPGGGYTFRVTAHSESVALQDAKGVSYAPNREFTELNLGASYVNNIDDHRIETIERCLADIFARRFALTPEFANTSVQDILGRSDKEALAKKIVRLSQQKKLHTLRYHGWETIIRLCSGDISYVIDILSNILRDRPAKYPVSKQVQSRAIRLYARSELYRTQDLSVGACNLFEVALNFGKFSLFQLLRAQVGDEKRPAEYLRLEVEVDRATERGRNALGELLRNGIFVDGGFSSSSRGTPARRLIFKKLFTPAFPTTYNSRDTWPMSARNFDEFVTDPKAFVKAVMSEHGVPPEEQMQQLDMLIEKA